MHMSRPPLLTLAAGLIAGGDDGAGAVSLTRPPVYASP